MGGYYSGPTTSGGSGAGLPPVNSTAVTAAGALPISFHTSVDATAGTKAMTLPTGQAAGSLISVAKYDSSANTVTVTGNVRGTGGTTITLSLQYESTVFEADAAGSWWPIADHKTLSSLDARHAPIARASIQTFDQSGVLSATVGTGRLTFPAAVTILGVVAAVNTAPTGAAILVDVNKNGTTIFTTQANRPSIAAAGNASSTATPDVTAFAAGDYMTVDIDQVGSTVPGTNLTVTVRYREA